MTRLAILILACMPLHLLSVRRAQAQTPSQALTTACYALEVGKWSRGYTEVFHHSLPDTIRFDSIRGTGVLENNGMQLRPRVDSRHSSYAYWTPLARDSVRLIWTTGFTAVVIRARIEGDTIRGVAEASVDMVGPEPFPTAPATAHKVACPPALIPPVTPDTLAAQRGSVLSGLTFGVPGYSAEPAPELFTIGVHTTHAVARGLGSEFAAGTMPRLLIEGVIAFGARAGPLLALMQSEQGLLTLSGGGTGILGFGAGGLVEPGVYAGGAAVFLKGDSGVRFGMTWHWFRRAESTVWLFEVGVVRKRSAR